MSSETRRTMAQMAKHLNYPGKNPGRNLRCYLKRRERRLGTQLLFPMMTRGTSIWTTTDAILREHCPELFLGVRDEFCRALGNIDRHLERVAEKQIEDSVAPRIDALEKYSHENRGMVLELAVKLRALLAETEPNAT